MNRYLMIPILAWLIIPVRSTRAEAPNPFGAIDQQAPIENEDEDFGSPPPPGDMNFQPPMQNQNQPGMPFGSNQNNGGGETFTPPPTNYQSRSSSPSVPSPNLRKGTTLKQVQPTPSASSPSASAKSAPKLADYLDLDTSIKGLEVKNFDVKDQDIKDVVVIMSKWTGKNFILDAKVRGKITIMGPSQVTLQEAYQAFLSALDANNLTTVQSGKYIRIIESAEARRAPVKTYSGEYAPKDDQFITRIFQLKYINADEVQREFRDLVTRQGKLFAYEPTNSIIITDTGSNIQRIRDILDSIDVKNFETTLHVLRIRNSSAKVIADMLGEIYGEDKGRSSQQRTSFRRSALERTRGGGLITKIIPDEQTNSLLVLANSSGFQQLERLVAKLDVKVTDTGRIHVYYCEYAKADDLAATLASLAGGGSASSGKATNRKTSVTTPNSPPGTTAPATPSGPVTAELEGGVKVTSDAATNSLVITANSADYQTLKRVIKKLDIPRLQVFVETAILELSVDSTLNVGVNAAVAGGGRAFGGGFIGDQQNLLNMLSNSGVPEGMTVPVFAGPASTVTGPNNTTFNVTSFMGMLNLLTKNSNSSLLSTPQIIALDNEKAEFKIIDEIPVQSTFTLSQGASVGTPGTGTIGTLKTGIEIKLTPHVNAASRNIRLEIEQTVDSLKDSTSVPSALQSIQRAKTSRVTNTSVVVKDQDYVVLGGLMSDKVDESVTKVPLLGDIPILGWLFKSRNFKTVKTNLVILLRPHIIGTSLASADLVNESLRGQQDYVNKTLGGENPIEDGVKKIKKRVRSQEKRGRNEPIFDYRNNDAEDEDAPTSGPRRDERSELAPKKSKPPEKPKMDSRNNPPLIPENQNPAMGAGDPLPIPQN